MRSIFTVVGVGLFASTALYAHDDWSLNNRVSVTGEFVYMRRAATGNKHLVNNRHKPQPCPPCIDLSVLESDDLMHNFEFEPGFRVGLAGMIDRKSSVEASFLYLFEWEGKKEHKGRGLLSFPFKSGSFTHDYYNADEARANYTSRFYTAEANYWRYMTPRRVDYFSFSWLAGVRYIFLKEHLKLAFTKGADTSDYSVNTHNNMGGLQVGVDLQCTPMRWFSWEIIAKVGGLVNHADQKTFLGDVNNTVVIHHFDVSRNNGTFFADASANIGLQMGSRYNAHIGYEFIYLSNVAAAPRQLSKGIHKNSGDRVNAGAHVIIHGLFVGLTFGF